MVNLKDKKTAVFVIGILIGFVLTGLAYKISRNVYLSSKKPKRYLTDQERKNFSFKDGLKIYTASSMDRIFRDGHTLVKPHFDTKADIALAKNEHESFQLVLEANEGSSFDVKVMASDFKSADGNSIIDKSNITIREVGYVPTITPYYPTQYVGLWPDPLLPNDEIQVADSQTHPVWISIYVPKETSAGRYEGTISVTGSNIASRNVPVTLTVYDFEIPKEGSLKTAFDFYGHITKKRHFQGEKESNQAYQARINALNEEYIIEMLKYRLNPILNIDPTSDAQLGAVDRYRVYGLNNFSIGRKGGTFMNNWPSSDEEIEKLLMQYRTYGEMLKLNRFLKYTYIYTWDEGEIGNPQVPKIASMIHRAYPGLKNMVCYHGFWEPEKHPKWGDDIDIWNFQIDEFDEPKMRALQERGMEMWTYVSGPSGYATPNFAIDFPSIDYRIITWLLWKYDIRGLLYWCVNWWPKADPFKNANNTKWKQNGNGLLFYPGEKGPMASLRLELIRDGLEDYEYLNLLSQGIEKLKDTKPGSEALIKEARKLLVIEAPLAEHMMNYTKESDVLMNHRNKIARTIEKINHILTAGE